ncbi:MAG TPA: FAD-binding oxidoreductase [Candidatus Limnocylindrales bacterium]|nr:FAD-binding oxidoreductase [Candidatus Limnocylindrales bacterium]
MTVAANALQSRISTLRKEIGGTLLEPADDGYDAARTITYGGMDRHPAAIVKVAGVDDIRLVLAAARETGAELAVRSGGHSGAGYGTTEGGLVIDLRDLRAIDIDPGTRTAWAETGLTAADVSKAAAEHGLAIGFGDTGSVGIGGITTGGGIGYLVRKHGLTIDNVLGADVVTADGALVRADPETNPDLFWAIRGGGGNFGIVTRFHYQLAELPQVVGGMLFLPLNAEIIQRFVELAEAAPEELSGIANAMPCPPMPMVDAAWHGKLVLFGLLCFAGDSAAGEAALRPFRDLSKLAGVEKPLADLVRPMPYPEMFPPEEGDYHPTAVSLNLLIDRFDRETADAIMAQLEASDAAMRAVQIRVMGGAMARVRWDATAFAHRTRKIMINVACFYEGEADKPVRQDWVDRTAEAIRRTAGATDRCAYVNFVNDEGAERIHDIYPDEIYRRLAEIKRRYDPGNVFRLNQNVPPA